MNEDEKIPDELPPQNTSQLINDIESVDEGVFNTIKSMQWEKNMSALEASNESGFVTRLVNKIFQSSSYEAFEQDHKL